MQIIHKIWRKCLVKNKCYQFVYLETLFAAVFHDHAEGYWREVISTAISKTFSELVFNIIIDLNQEEASSERLLRVSHDN